MGKGTEAMNLGNLIASGLTNLVKAKKDNSGNQLGFTGEDGRIYHGLKTGVAALQRFGGADPGTGTGAGTGVGYMMDVQRTAPFPFAGVRLLFENYDTTAPLVINKAGVAVTADVVLGSGADLGKYSGGPAGNTLTWTAATFNGLPNASVPVAVAGNGGTGAGIHLRPGQILSDFIPIRSVPRFDGSPLPFLRTRAHVNDNSFVLNLNQSLVTGLATIANAPLTGGHIMLTGQKSTVTAANLFTDTLAPFFYGSNIAPVGVIFYGYQQVRELVAFGDSLTQGVKSTSGYLGWPTRLDVKYGYLNAGSGLILSAANHGVSGQYLENSLANCRNYCAVRKPHFASFYAWSPNNALSGGASLMNSLWSDVLNTIDTLLQLGVTPVVLTSGPVNYFAGGDAALWRTQNDRVMALPSSVIKVDIATPLTKAGTYFGNSPQIATAYDAGDNTHYTDSAYAMIADMVRAAIR